MFKDIPIFLIVYITSLILIIFKFRLKELFLLLIPILALIKFFSYDIGFEYEIFINSLNSTITLIKIDEISKYFGILFLCSLFITNLFSLNNFNKTEIFFSQIYAGSALGAILTDNLMVSFIFLEIMSISATFIICSTKEKESILAGFRYLFIHLLAGVILLIGILFYYHFNQDFTITKLELNSFYSYLILLGLGINAGFPLFHTWIPDSYSKASYSGTVYLSIFTTKTAIYLIFRLFNGQDLLILIGTIMSTFSIFYVILENDLRKIFSYLLINQLGFLLVSIGLDNDLAQYTFFILLFSHIVYDTILFMSAGVIIYSFSTPYLSELANFYSRIPYLFIFYIIGALAISGFPLTSGYIGKTMLLNILKENRDTLTYILLLFSSACTALVAIFKIPQEIFFPKDNNKKIKNVPINMTISLLILSLIIILFGILPKFLVSITPAKTIIDPFKITKIFEKIQFFSFIFLSYLLLRRYNLFPESKKATYLDIDWFFRKPLYNLIQSLDKLITDYLSSLSPSRLFLNMQLLKTGRFTEANSQIDSIGYAVLMSLLFLFTFAVILIAS